VAAAQCPFMASPRDFAVEIKHEKLGRLENRQIGEHRGRHHHPPRLHRLPGGSADRCDYQFYSHLLIGVEGAVSGSTMKSSTVVGFPAGFPGDQGVVSSKTDFIPSVTARLGIALDRVLLYGKGGVAWAGDQTNVVGSVAGTPFSFQGLSTRTGFTAGGGVAWAFSGPWSVSVEYDYYGFGHGNVFMTDLVNGFSGLLDTKQSIQVVKVGLNFHLWSYDQ
jgi:outer membrane immunogenic protein